PANVAARTVAPSFDCAATKGDVELEICSDPELARRDAEIARVWRDTLRRLDPKNAGLLRDDQRAWIKDNATVLDVQMHPSWDKGAYFVHHLGNARHEFNTRLIERFEMLANLDEKRQGIAGFWFGHN